MSSDDAYTFFLERANADPSSGTQPSSKKHNPSSFHTTKTIDDDQHVPQVLADVEIYYISDTDEAFDPVVLDWPAAGEGEGRWPSTAEFKSLISPSNQDTISDLEISAIPPSKFDPHTRYEPVFHAIRAAIEGSEARAKSEAGKPEIRVYRIEHGGTRVEYWVLGLDRGGKRLVGMKARAVES